MCCCGNMKSIGSVSMGFPSFPPLKKVFAFRAMVKNRRPFVTRKEEGWCPPLLHSPLPVSPPPPATFFLVNCARAERWGWGNKSIPACLEEREKKKDKGGKVKGEGKSGQGLEPPVKRCFSSPPIQIIVNSGLKINSQAKHCINGPAELHVCEGRPAAAQADRKSVV